MDSNSQWRIPTWFPELSDDVKKKLEILFHEQLNANKSLAFFSSKMLPFVDLIHFADSIIASKSIIESNAKIDKIFDIGSGTGLPGLVMAVMYPKVQVVCLEIDPKKAEVISKCIALVGAKNASVVVSNVESLPAGSIKYCMARGFANISKSILNLRKQVIVGGVFYHIKGENWGAEVGEIPSQLCSVWTPALVKNYVLPVGTSRFAVVKTDKIS